jgi:hypothetical protein
MKKTIRRGASRFPSARVKGIREFLNLLQTEQEWRPDPLTAGTLKTLGIAPSKEGELIQALKFLEVLDENGHPTEAFDRLRSDFQGTLARQVKNGYAKLISTVPANRITQQTLVRFFMQSGYCEDTAEYQGVLFVGLCKDAGIDLPNVDESFMRARFKKLPRSRNSKATDA